MSETPILNSETSIETVVLPEVKLSTYLQPVSAMLRNCLITANPKLKELDFTHLQMFIPVLTEGETRVNAQVLVKATSANRYKLESKQIFTYTRIDADEALTTLGIADRIFPKSYYQKLFDILSDLGTLTIASGEVTDEFGDVVATFNFGEKYKEFTSSKFIDLGSNAKNKNDFSVAFRGVVKFTFKGKPKPIDTTKIEDENDTRIDVGPFFLNTHLGDVFGNTNKGVA